MIELIEAERARLGRELHTGVGQLLVSILRQAELAEAQLPPGESAVSQTLGRISASAADALAMRCARWERGCIPPNGSASPWKPPSSSCGGSAAFRNATTRELDLAALPASTEPVIKALFYRAAQEALSNIDEHSHATRVRLTLAARRRSDRTRRVGQRPGRRYRRAGRRPGRDREPDSGCGRSGNRPPQWAGKWFSKAGRSARN
jgi:two-component system NarL family sensor kinase